MTYGNEMTAVEFASMSEAANYLADIAGDTVTLKEAYALLDHFGCEAFDAGTIRVYLPEDDEIFWAACGEALDQKAED